MFDWISFSIDSTDEFVNEAIGRGREHLGIVVKLLELCHSKIKIKINTVANQYNLNDLETIYQLISTYHIDQWKIFRFYPLRRGNKNRDLFYVDEWESQEIERFVAEKKKYTTMQIHYNNFDEYKTSYFNIYSDGSVENQDSCTIGNLLEDDIFDILK